MHLGAFSISLAVNDLQVSRAFYEKLGFSVAGGSEDQDYLILRNGEATIGLFQGMFEDNILTFNPGLLQDMSQPEEFDDVRKIQQHLLDAGIELDRSADPDGTGPDHITLFDPDGNAILIDQFFDDPGCEGGTAGA